MSGVIMADGTQWEHCQGCQGSHEDDSYSERGRWVRIQDLYYQEPNEMAKFGRDLCADCIRYPEECDMGTCRKRATALAQFADEPESSWVYQLCDEHADKKCWRPFTWPF